MKTVLVDMDGILANLQDSWYPKYNAVRPEGWPELTPENVTDWSIPNAHSPTVWDIIAQPGLYRNLKPLPGAIEGLKALRARKDLEIQIVTSATIAPHTPTEKIQWMGEHFPFISQKNIITCYNKSLIRGDVLIDDGPTNVPGWLVKNPDKKALMITYPYNEKMTYSVGEVIRVGTYKDTEKAWANIVLLLRGY